MLTVTRKANESVRIGDDIEVHVVEVRGKRVRLRFHAPNDKKIYRSELLERTSQIPSVHFHDEEPHEW
jgi:carbon storage regulator